MNIYSPYLPVVDTPERLELQLGRGRSRFFFMYFRALPVVFFVLALIMRQVISGSDMPVGFLVFPVMLVFVGVVLRSNRYITAVTVDKTGASIRAKQLIAGETTKQFAAKDIKSLQTVVQEGRGGGAFFFLELKDGSRQKLLVIPQADMNKNSIEQVSAALAKRLRVSYH